MNGLAVFIVIAAMGQTEASGSSFGWQSIEGGKLEAIVHISPRLAMQMQTPGPDGKLQEISIPNLPSEYAAQVARIIVRIDDSIAPRKPSLEELKAIQPTRDRSLMSLNDFGNGGFRTIDNTAPPVFASPPKAPPLDTVAQSPSTQNSLRDRDSDMGPGMRNDPRSLPSNSALVPPPAVNGSTGAGSGMPASFGLGDQRTGRSDPTSASPNFGTGSFGTGSFNLPPTSTAGQQSFNGAPGSSSASNGMMSTGLNNSGFSSVPSGSGVSSGSGFSTSSSSPGLSSNNMPMGANSPPSSFNYQTSNTNYPPNSTPSTNATSGYMMPPTWGNPSTLAPSSYGQGSLPPSGSNGFSPTASAFARSADARSNPGSNLSPGASVPSLATPLNGGNVHPNSLGYDPNVAFAPRVARSSDQTFLPILFLFSLVGNIYLWIWIARLRDRYRALLASVRSTSVS